MRTKHDTVGEKFANLLLEKKIGFSSFIEELSEAIENEIRERNGESSTFDESDSEDEHTSNGRTYYDFNLLNDYEPHESIEHLLKNEKIDSLVELSDEGYSYIKVMRTYMGHISHEWDLALRVSESPHSNSGKFIELRIVLEFMFGHENRVIITRVGCDISDEDLSKIYIAYALKYD